jgi:hypothetical protein
MLRAVHGFVATLGSHGHANFSQGIYEVMRPFRLAGCLVALVFNTGFC